MAIELQVVPVPAYAVLRQVQRKVLHPTEPFGPVGNAVSAATVRRSNARRQPQPSVQRYGQAAGAVGNNRVAGVAVVRCGNPRQYNRL